MLKQFPRDWHINQTFDQPVNQSVDIRSYLNNTTKEDLVRPTSNGVERYLEPLISLGFKFWLFGQNQFISREGVMMIDRSLSSDGFNQKWKSVIQ